MRAFVGACVSVCVWEGVGVGEGFSSRACGCACVLKLVLEKGCWDCLSVWGA